MSARLGILAILFLLAGCAGHQAVLRQQLGPDMAAVELSDTVFYPQDAFQCGPAALATLLDSSGVQVTPEQLTPQVYLPGRHGSLQVELLSATRRHGRIPYQLDRTLAAIAAQLRAGERVLVLQNVGFEYVPVWHYAVVIGIDPLRDEVILRSGTTERLVLSARKFLDQWEDGDYWAFIALEPGQLPAQADPLRYLRAAADMEAVGRYQDALAAFAAGRQHWPDMPEMALGVASGRYRLGDLAGAERAYREILQRWPANVVALNNLAMLRGEQGCRAEALTLIEQAQRLDDGHLAVQLTQSRNELEALATAEAAQCLRP